MTRMSRHLEDCIIWSHENAGGAQWTRKKVTVVVDSGAAENGMPWNMFPDISTEETQRCKPGKGCRGPGGEHI